MARPKNSADVAPQIRGAFKRACLMLDGDGPKGEGLSTLILNSLNEDVRGTLQAIKGFVPRELDVDLTATELTHEQWLLELSGGEDGPATDSET